MQLKENMTVSQKIKVAEDQFDYVETGFNFNGRLTDTQKETLNESIEIATSQRDLLKKLLSRANKTLERALELKDKID